MAKNRNPTFAARLELHQDVDVAFRAEIVAQNGPEQRQATDAVAATEFGNAISSNIDPVIGHLPAHLGFRKVLRMF